jgi:hypothetical protein
MTTIHEWRAAEETGWFRPSRVIKTFGFEDSISFDGFVDHFYSARRKAKSAGDKIHDLFYKLILNSAYGKFAQNPDNFADYAITHGAERLDSPWQDKHVSRNGEYVIWTKPCVSHNYYHVAVGASITGAARATLVRALYRAINPVYCDTDSIICESIPGVTKSDAELGAWKIEAKGDRIAIAGKKMYAFFDGDKCIKKAHKGARIGADDIVAVASGSTVTSRNDAPTFKLDGSVQFIKREIRRTV